MIRFEEQETQFRKCNDEKLHEVAQLTSLLEQVNFCYLKQKCTKDKKIILQLFSIKVREDSARQVARTKERSEMMRKTMQNQISEMERQLAQCRATAKAAQKDRDEVIQLKIFQTRHTFLIFLFFINRLDKRCKVKSII